MRENRKRALGGRTIIWGVVGVAAIVVAAILVLTQLTGNDLSPRHVGATISPHETSSASPTPAPEESDGQPSPDTGALLPETMNGQEAIDALGENIEIVASRNGMTVDKLKALLLRDEAAHVSTDGAIVYRDDVGPDE